ncbi:transcription termination/antitermination protein NusG [candidate division KSB3 bacterium]|uniref:Transcription termination/antitermination protein NusG n=1 Tax=candidate division KSB3 bacterium TaxID=2044937 RepID=A0A2G6K7X6_9BACT|nr:MAG: transcription termination/antitermination protein NusG [candidate division KSB3 bacterium]
MEQKWAYFKEQEYQHFVARFPHLQDVLEPLKEEESDRVRINVDGLSDEQQTAFDSEAFHELKGHIHRWYVIHTYSGYEKVVKDNLEQRLRTVGLSARVSEILIPTEDVMEVKGGKKQVFTKRSFPGYVFVKMEVDDEVWYAIRNTPKVSGFVGGAKPAPLLDSEIDAILKQMKETSERPQPKVLFEQGESVRIIDGPFSNFTGVVDNVYPEQGKLKVMVTIFGRSTPVELEFGQVEKGES